MIVLREMMNQVTKLGKLFVSVIFIFSKIMYLSRLLQHHFTKLGIFLDEEDGFNESAGKHYDAGFFSDNDEDEDPKNFNTENEDNDSAEGDNDNLNFNIRGDEDNEEGDESNEQEGSRNVDEYEEIGVEREVDPLGSLPISEKDDDSIEQLLEVRESVRIMHGFVFLLTLRYR